MIHLVFLGNPKHKHNASSPEHDKLLCSFPNMDEVPPLMALNLNLCLERLQYYVAALCEKNKFMLHAVSKFIAS